MSASLAGGNPFNKLWSAYERQLERRPVVTQMTTSMLLWGAGDIIAQRIEHWEKQQAAARQQAAWQLDKKKQRRQKAAAPPPPPGQRRPDDAMDVDWRRALFTGLFGATCVGPVGHFWYQAIDKWCRALVPGGGPKFIASKVFIDTAAMGPFYIAAFFAWGCALIDGSGLPEFKRKMRCDFAPTLAAEVSVWPLVQAVNFSVVPLKHQLLVINTFTIMDAAFMSWARGQQDWVAKVVAGLERMTRGGGGGGGGGNKLQMQALPAPGSKR